MDLHTSYKTLDLMPGSSFKEIKNAYKAKVKQYHPDQYTNQVYSQFIAENKLKEINLAFETLKALHGNVPEASPPSLSKVTSRSTDITTNHSAKKKATSQNIHISQPHQKARKRAKKMACDPIDISHLSKVSSDEYRQARTNAHTTVGKKLQDVSRAESDISQYQTFFENKFFKKKVYEIQSDHRFKWQTLKKLISKSGS